MYAFTAKDSIFFTVKEVHYNHCINQKLLWRQTSVFILVHLVKENPIVFITLTSNS